jgi:hypothetical protein
MKILLFDPLERFGEIICNARRSLALSPSLRANPDVITDLRVHNIEYNFQRAVHINTTYAKESDVFVFPDYNFGTRKPSSRTGIGAVSRLVHTGAWLPY